MSGEGWVVALVGWRVELRGGEGGMGVGGVICDGWWTGGDVCELLGLPALCHAIPRYSMLVRANLR